MILLAARLRPSDPPRFLPLLCVFEGRLAGGAACGERMPEATRLRTSIGPLSVARATGPLTVRTDDGDETFTAPRGPSCCNYKHCDGETIPYYATPGPAVPDRTLAVWPEDASVDLVLGDGLAVEPVASGPWTVAGVQHRARAVKVGTRRVASVWPPPCGRCGALWVDEGAGWRRWSPDPDAAGHDVLGTSDLDGDGRREVVVYERWANDYTLFVLGNDWKDALHQFGCGSI